MIYEKLAPVFRPSTRTLGVVGLGRIGSRVAARARAFGWNIVGADAGMTPDQIRERGAEPVSLDELFRRSDAITLHCPLTSGQPRPPGGCRATRDHEARRDHRQHLARWAHRHRSVGRGRRLRARLGGRAWTCSRTSHGRT